MGLHNLFRLSSMASIEGYYRAPDSTGRTARPVRQGADRDDGGCPSGEVNRWLQAGNYDKALAAAADFQDILGKENYFCEVMDHGIDIERRFRTICCESHGPWICRSWRPTTPTMSTPDDWRMHDAFLCVGNQEPAGRRQAVPVRQPRFLHQDRRADAGDGANCRGLRQHASGGGTVRHLVRRGRQPHAPVPRSCG